jgi:hypothetical protein
MARLRRRSKERPPQTIHVSLTLDQHELLTQNKVEKDEALYQVLQRVLVRYEELQFINEDLKESLKESRIKRAELEAQLQKEQEQVVSPRL